MIHKDINTNLNETLKERGIEQKLPSKSMSKSYLMSRITRVKQKGDMECETRDKILREKK